MIITPDHVVAVWDGLSSIYGTTIHDKDDSEFMASIGWALNMMGVMDKEAFLESYSTTVFYDIYNPFKPGEIDPSWSLWGQILIATHEHIHAWQCRKKGRILYAADYLSKDSRRANYEAEALRSALELHWWDVQDIPDSMCAELARKLYNYACDADEVKWVEEFLLMSAELIRQGATINPVTRETIKILEAA